MRREESLDEISDGKLYTSNDLVKAGCNDCNGCSSCCKGMGNSLVLDPYDICQMTNGLNVTFMELLEGKLQLNVVDGVILPNMAMAGKDEACGFLNSEGRCGIHDIRPGICRLFPLGRYYENVQFSENNTFKYIIQINECKKENRTKVKIKNFLGIENLKEYEKYITDWHYFLKEAEAILRGYMQNGKEEKAKSLTMDLLNTFFIMPYGIDTFFEDYYERRKKYNEICNQDNRE